MKKTHLYENYDDYIKFQLKKTSDKSKQKKWLGPEWQVKIDIFKNLFNNNINYIKNKKNAICLGSRTGQEVVALKDLGITDVIGIDLHEFEPYTIKGDIHNLDFDLNHFDFAFTNILDHSLYPEKFASEVTRVLKKNGIFILHVQYAINQDKYTEVIIENINQVEVLFKGLKLIKKNKIESGIIAMNYEFIFVKE